jgi:hypothetical protein
VKKPASLLYGSEDRPPLAVTALTGLQHAGVNAIFLLIPLLARLVRETLRYLAAASEPDPVNIRLGIRAAAHLLIHSGDNLESRVRAALTPPCPDTRRGNDAVEAPRAHGKPKQ